MVIYAELSVVQNRDYIYCKLIFIVEGRQAI